MAGQLHDEEEDSVFGMDAIGIGVNVVDGIVQNADSVLEGSLELMPRRIDAEPARDAGPELQASRKPSGTTHPHTPTPPPPHTHTHRYYAGYYTSQFRQSRH
jgi:hypothetical protein